MTLYRRLDPPIGRNRTNVWDIVGIISLDCSLLGDDVQRFAQVNVVELTFSRV